MRAPPRALLLDVGLTLVHPNGGVMLEELRRELPDMRRGEEDLVAALVLAAEARHPRLPAGDGDGRVAAAWAMLLGLPPEPAQRAWRRAVARPDLYDGLDPGATALLAGLRERGLRVAAVSNSDGTLDAELDRFGLSDCFDLVVDSTVAGVEKPDPRIYRGACADLGLPPERCWFLGDGLVNDVIAAEGAGIGLGILYDRFDLYPHLTGVARVPRLQEVLSLVERGYDRHEAPAAPARAEGMGETRAHA